MRILAIDPGPKQSAMVLLLDDRIHWATFADNELWRNDMPQVNHVVIEDFRMYGVRGEDSKATILWAGRFWEIAELEGSIVTFIHRDQVRKHLCPGCPKVKDGDVRAAIIDRYGGKEKAIGRKKSPGPLYGVKSHCWSALALALTLRDRLEVQKESVAV